MRGETFKMKSMFNIDAGMQKQVLKGKGTVRATVTDIFHTLKFRGTSDFAGQTTSTNFQFESRQFKLNFVYRFGSNQVKAARQRATGAEDENKRVGAASSGTIGQ